MLPAWYFCCCLNATTDKATVFLSILEIFENHDGESELVPIALGELQRADLWMQIYALSAVLGLRRAGDAGPALRAVIDEYLENLIQHLPDEASEAFRSLNASLTAGPEDTRGAVRACSKAISKLPPRRTTSTPYLDLKEFLPETYLLSVVLDRVLTDDAFAFVVAKELDDRSESSVFDAVLDAALTHALGRLAFCAAVRIAHAASSEHSEHALLSRICTCSTAPLALQPDLLHACAEILFRRPGAGGAASPVKEIVFESILFTRLRALALIEPRREKDPSAPLGFVGLLGNEGLTQALMLVYWQAVLWELAVRLDPVEAAPILAVLWAPRVGGRHDLTVLGPVPRAEIDIWDHQLRALLRLRDERGLRLVVRSGKNVEAGRDASWALFSPWLALNPDPGKWTRFDIHDLRYPGATSAPLLVRLLVAATAAVRVLRRAPPEHESRGALAAVIAHAADVLDLFRTDLTPGGRRDPLLRRQFFSLARHARTQVTLAGSGELASIDPAEFVSYVRWVHHARPGERPRGDHGAFFLSILPGVLLTWAAEALPCAVSTSGAIRWFPLIHEVYDYYRPHRPSFPHHLVTSLLLRFVEPGFALDVDWCDFRDTIELGRSDRGRGEKSVRYEQILLARDVPVEVWLEPYWRSQRLWPNSALALALARLAALEQADTTTDVQERWHSEWVALVNRARSTDDLPIFLRLRLLELLDAPVLAGRPEEQTLICLTLLEHGSIHELERLFKRVFATDEEGFQRQIPETRRQVRLMLLRALHQHAAMAGDDVASRPNAQDPRRTLEEAARRALVRRMMVILAYFNPPSLSAVLTELHADTLKPRTEASRRSTGHLDGAGTQRRVVRGADDIAVRDGAVQAAVYDRNRLVVSLFADDFDTGDCLDLFEADPADAEAVRNLVEAHPLRVLAWVVDTKDRRDGHWFYTFHCGLDYYVTSIERWLGVAVGDCVELPIQPSVDRSRWVVIRNGDIGQFKGKLRPGDVEELRLTETGPYRELHLNAKKVPREILALWDPDRSRAFAPGPVERRPRAVLARFRPGLLPAPLELDLIHLLLHARRGAAGSPFVLTFAGTVTTALGEQAFQLSAQPGQSYVLRVEQFASEDAGRLRDMLIDAHRGMLVVLSARLEGGEVRLGLAAAAAETPDIARRYPGLTAPFDDRNLRWRQVLSGDETEIAEWSGHDWMIHLHDRRVPGFPEAVRVEEWEGTRFSHHDRSRVELVVTHWASRRGVVRGRHVPFDQLEVSNTAEFFRRWWHLGPGLRVTIARYGRDVQDDGYVTCYTPENIRVKVEPESLTMRPWDHEVRAELGAERQVQLFEAEFRKPKATPEIDPTELPAVAHEMGCCFGILKRVPSRTDVKATLCAVLWSNDGHVTEGNLTLANLAELRPSPGWRLEGERDARGVWWFRLLYYVLRGRALWSIEEAGPRDANLLYLGKVSYQGQPRAIAERRPGNLVLLPSAVPGAQHLSRGSGARFTGGIERGQETVNTPRAFSWVEGGRVPVTLRRAVLRLRSSILSGDCHADAPETNVAWAGAELALVRHDDDLVWLRRLLLLEPIQRVAAQRAVARQARPIADVATQRRKEMESALERYFESPTDLEAAVLAAAGSSGDRRELGQERVELRTLRVPAEGAGSRWVSTVDMAPGEGAFVLGQDYPREPAVVRLLRDGGGRVFASCREVPPYTAQEYRKKLNVRYGEPARPDGLFHYVGPEQRSAENGEPGETHHRFEWGYGSTLLVPERCLRFAGGPFANARLALFHGDLIESVTFSLDEATEPEREGPSSARAHDGECVMSIDGAYIKQSEGSVLYKERTRYTLVHHLEIVLGDDLEVVSVLGCTKKLDANSHDYERVRARLDDASKKRLLQRFGAAADDDGERAQRIRVLGRLDDAVFRATFGRVVEFRHVRMSFRDSPLGPPLHHNEALFVQTNGARPTRSQNDIELRLKPFQGMPEDEIGDDIRNDLMLLRGRFSTRRGLLPRLHRERSEILQDSALLVRIQQDEDGRPLVSLRDNIPPRPPESLASAIAKESSALLATVVSATPRGVLLELRPGVFVHLGPDRLGATPYNFDAGTIVSVENRPHASFEITRAAFSDARYVGEEPRPVVVLPKSSPLLRDNVFDKWDVEDPSFWTAREDFTIGSLPNLVAQAGSYDEGTGHWSGPRAEDCITLLETPHPKIARVARRNDRIYVTRPSPDDAWGWLELQGREREVSLVWFHGDEEHRTEAEWSELTFADEPANRVQSRVRRERWRYHDARTGHWSAQGVVSRELREHDAETGPLFFELVDARPRLRYRPGSLLRNGFPVDELVQSLLRAGPGGASYPRRRALAPGRLDRVDAGARRGAARRTRRTPLRGRGAPSVRTPLGRVRAR
jgi:hypothetical protein